MHTVFSKLDRGQIDRLFPFYFVLNESLRIFEYGRSVPKIVELGKSDRFLENFRLMRPNLSEIDFEALARLQNQLVVLQIVGQEHRRIRGQFELLENPAALVFMGSPWFNDINELQETGLSLFDFAFFDPLADLLQVVKNQEIATNDIKELLAKLRQQKQALEEKTKELQSNQTRLSLLSTIAEKTINGVIITNRHGHIDWVNESFTRITGYTLNEIIGKKPGQFLQGEETDRETIAYLSSQVKNGQPFSCEILNYHKDGSKYWVKVLGNPLLDATGETIGFFALEEDITAQIQTEQTLREAKEKSDALAHSKNIFLTNMSHEMRTPLNAILGMGQQFEKTELDDQQKFFLETINSAAEHLLVVINDILDISRVEAGKLKLENIDFDVRMLITRCINVLSPKAEEKGLLLKAFIDNDIAGFLVGDPHRLNQVLFNLLGNALKFTEHGSVRLFVTSLHNDAKTQSLRFSVEDTGIGIEDDFLRHLFSEFSQEDSSFVRKYGGTGLGLNITKKLVDLMGGTISVESKKNTGTTFNIELTLPVGTNLNAPPDEPNEIDPVILKDKLILLVEDNEMNRILARTILRSYRVQLIEAENGKRAVEILQERSPDLILMDIQMPVMNGMEATAYIRENLGSDVPIIALTANALKGEREKCLAGGMNEYLPKPFREKDLIQLICRLLIDRAETEQAVDRNGTTGTERLYSFDYLNEVCEGNADFIYEMVESFASEADVVLRDMPDHLKNGELEEMQRLAHKIKSNLLMFEARETAKLAERFERLDLSGKKDVELLADDFMDNLQRLLTKLEADGYLKLEK